MKLWTTKNSLDKKLETFIIDNDQTTDLLLAEYDIIGSLAHILMLKEIESLSKIEHETLKEELINILKKINDGKFRIEQGIEDIHSQTENMLTKRCGETGKKIHTARSRNDQVLLDIKLFSRKKLTEIVKSMTILFETFLELSDKFKDTLMPGHTHLQIAMPSSFGLWFASFAESLSDDLRLLLSAFEIVNQNPLGSAAGYGSSFPVDRKLTTELLGFEDLSYNSIYAQSVRGKLEQIVCFSLGSIAGTLSRFASDSILYMNKELGYICLPDTFTTGSSIMPHKKNPDIFEVLRAKCNVIRSLPNQMMLITANLTTGYFRDMQIIKEAYLKSFDSLIECIEIVDYTSKQIRVKDDILSKEKYKFLFSVEEVNKLVQKGIPFRDAYTCVKKDIENNSFNPEREPAHTHEGSIGNLCNEQIREKYCKILNQFPFEKITIAEKKLRSN